MTCKLHRFENNKMMEYNCYEVSNLEKKWKEDFRIQNRTDDCIRIYGRDRTYERYCKEIDDFMEQCECLKDKCDKCKPEDHEGDFCRCEMRNIALAKQKRERKESAWEKNKLKNNPFLKKIPECYIKNEED